MKIDKYEVIKERKMWDLWKNDTFVCSSIHKKMIERIRDALINYKGE